MWDGDEVGVGWKVMGVVLTVLSPLCGMETVSGVATGSFATLTVLSPLCGMETFYFEQASDHLHQF